MPLGLDEKIIGCAQGCEASTDRFEEVFMISKGPTDDGLNPCQNVFDSMHQLEIEKLPHVLFAPEALQETSIAFRGPNNDYRGRAIQNEADQLLEPECGNGPLRRHEQAIGGKPSQSGGQGTSLGSPDKCRD